MSTVSLWLVWLHIVAAAVWLGGMIFLSTVLMPTVRSPEFASQASVLVRATGIRFRRVGWIAIITLIATGLLLLTTLGVGPAQLFDLQFWSSAFGLRVALKVCLVGLVVALSLVHDFWIGPRAGAAARADPGGPAAVSMRRTATRMGRLNLILALLIAAVGVTLSRG